MLPFKTSGLENVAPKWAKEQLQEFFSGDYPFSTYVKFSKKLKLLTLPSPIRTHTCVCQGYVMLVLWKLYIHTKWMISSTMLEENFTRKFYLRGLSFLK